MSDAPGSSPSAGPAGHVDGQGPGPVLELSAVDVPFGGRPGLSGVELAVQASERFVLVGASGAGKSSLLRAIAGSGRVTRGSILVDGDPVAGKSPRDRNLVLLEQRPLLFPHLSVRGNVAFPLEVRGHTREETHRRVADVLDAIRLPDLADRMPHTLSGGQAHRVALARAVVVRPRVLLLDEPLTSLDPGLREDMRAAIAAVCERYATAVLMVTHDLREAGRIGERVGVLVRGRLAQVAVPEVLFRAPASLEVARFIGWRNELPARIDEDGSLCIRDWRAPGPWHAGPGEAALPGPVAVSFGARGARLLAPSRGQGPLVEITALKHDPHGTTAEYRLEGSSHGGEVAVDADAAPAVGATAALEVLPSRARVYAVPEAPDNHDRT